MNTNFTPGPWSVLHGKEFDGHPYHNIYCTETGNIIAHAWGDYDNVNSANADLIAAAPEMYADLNEAVVEMCEHCDSYVAMKCTKEDGKCFVQRWRKTLEKARGEK